MTIRRTLGAASLVLVSMISTARAEGEVEYYPGVCGGPHGSPPPRYSTLLDLPIIFERIAQYTLLPEQMYTGVWTNWYRESDTKKRLAKLATMRSRLESGNLWDTNRVSSPQTFACDPYTTNNRTIDGTCNDQAKSWMGSVGSRFGRNMNPNGWFAQAETTTLMSPSPREVSRILFTRDSFKPVPFLNMFAAAWIQFQVHDWFNHTLSQHAYHDIPLAADDPFRLDGQTVMKVAKTAPDPSRLQSEAAMGPTYPNEVTHWWDGSQIYGSDPVTAARLRTYHGGKLRIDDDGLLPKAADGFEDTGFRNNWWVGLALMHNLFAREHNAIADMLAQRYPLMTDQELYDKARMINAAVIVKIHTVEWTPAIIPNPSLEVGMNANWYGLNKYLWPKLVTLPGYIPLPYRHVIFGIRGGSRELHKDPELKTEVPFALTEEFVSVYRMHTLLPDTINLSRIGGQSIGQVELAKVRNADARRLEERVGASDLMYTFGIEHPGGLVLNNYPELLQNLKVPFLGRMDIGAVDVLRDRERGVPRYNEFRRQLLLKPLASIDQLTDDPVLRESLKDVYGHDAGAIERVDLLVGTLAEGTRPTCYGFGETLFQVFTLMASRRLHADRFYTSSYNATTYTQAGLDWIDAASFKSVLLRHHPELAATGLAGVTNAFYPWE
ncbi:MAG: peroxidase [Kofleriaceae bacterium]|nr:MAG: peroxidase [Kofleriaceae bacterium]MBZ0237289.1 peroxidase [Kofleriaceae bacterium]